MGLRRLFPVTEPGYHMSVNIRTLLTFSALERCQNGHTRPAFVEVPQPLAGASLPSPWPAPSLPPGPQHSKPLITCRHRHQVTFSILYTVYFLFTRPAERSVGAYQVRLHSKYFHTKNLYKQYRIEKVGTRY